MSFKKQDYRKAKEKVVNMIKATHDWKGNEGFIADGIISVEEYEKAPIKILVVLAESYDYNKDKCTDIETQVGGDILGIQNPKVKSTTKIAALAHAIFKSVNEHRKLTRKELDGLFRTLDPSVNPILESSLHKIAWINVKKASRDQKNSGTKMSYNDIVNSAKRNKEIIELQIKSIAPDLILLCSDAVINGVFDNHILKVDSHRIKFSPIKSNGNQTIVLTTHPAYARDWSYDGLYNLYLKIYETI